jgi:capsular exopolysaccharide synthesis family protein
MLTIQPGKNYALEDTSVIQAIPDTSSIKPQRRDFSFLDIWRIVQRRKWLVLSLLLLTLAITTLITLLSTPIYRASSLVEVDLSRSKLVSFSPLSNPLGGDENDPAQRTQYEKMKSYELAKRVINEIGLETIFPKVETPLKKYLSGFLPSLSGGDKNKAVVRNPLEEPIKMFHENLSINPVARSHLVQINYDSPDPVLSARVVNTLIDNYVKIDLEKSSQTDTYTKKFLEEELSKARERLNKAEADVVEYAKENGILSLDDNHASSSAKLQELQKALVTAEIQRIEAESLYKQAAQPDNISDLVGNRIAETLKTQLVALQAEYQNGLKVFTPQYPDMQRLKQQISVLQSQVNNETKKSGNTYRARYLAAKSSEDNLRKKVNAYKKDLLKLQDSSIEYMTLQRETETSRQLYKSLFKQLEELNVIANAGASNINVIDVALPPEKKFKPSKKVNLLLGTFVGLVLGLLAAFLRESFDQSITSSDMLQQLTGMPILGVVPNVKKYSDKQLAMVVCQQPHTVVAESYRAISANLRLTQTGKTLLISSAQPGEGKTTTAINFACAHSQMGMKVLLIDADLRKPTIHSKMGLGNTSGLSNYLTGKCSIAEATQQLKNVEGLFVITAGSIAGDPVSFLSNKRMAQMIELAVKQFDIVIIDSPPAMGFADSLILASLVDSIILTASEDKMTRNKTNLALAQINQVNRSILGFVITQKETGMLRHKEYMDYYESGRLEKVA